MYHFFYTIIKTKKKLLYSTIFLNNDKKNDRKLIFVAALGRIQYRLYVEKESFDDANSICMNDFNGTLAMLRSQEQTDAIVNLINNRTTDRRRAVTFGIRRREGTNFAYINGDLISTIDFQNWAPTEPNNFFGNEDCGTLYTNGQWNDDVCSVKHNFICERGKQF